MGLRSIGRFIRKDRFKMRIAERIGADTHRIISVFILVLATPLALAGTNIFGGLLEGIGTAIKENNPTIAGTAGTSDNTQAGQTGPLNLTREADNRNLFSSASDGNHNPHVLAIHKGKLYGYGGNRDGELAHGEVTRETSSGSVFYRNPAKLTVPSQIDLPNVYKVVTSHGRTFVLLDDGSLLAFGRSTRDELGGGLSGVIPVPRKIDGIENIVDVRTNGLSGFVIALRSDGSVWHWGSNIHSTVERSRANKWKMTTASPERLNVRPVKKILVRNERTFAITTEGQLIEIHANKERFIGSATDVTDFLNANDDCQGNYCPVYFVDSKGKTYVTGPNNGTYGNGTADSGDEYQEATPTPELNNMTSIASYFLTSIGLDKSGGLYVWGSERGCMPYPVEAKGLPKFLAISSAHGSFWGLTKSRELVSMPLDALCRKGRFAKIAIPAS